MPRLLKCNKCGETIEDRVPDSTGWSIEMRIGGTEVRCPKCAIRLKSRPLLFTYKTFNGEVTEAHDIMKAFRKKK